MTDSEKKYADIINASWPVDETIFLKHPRMPLAQRAKIFAPFEAVRTHGEKLADELTKLERIRKPELSEWKQNLLSEKVSNLYKGMDVEIEYFLPDAEEKVYGYQVHLFGTILRIDTINRKILLSEKQDAEKSVLDKPEHIEIDFDSLMDIFFHADENN